MKNTYENFLSALQMFRECVDSNDLSTMPTITQYIADYIADKNNKLFVLADKEHHPLIDYIGGGECLFVYSSIDEFNKDNKGKDFIYFIDNAYNVFLNASRNRKYSSIIIDKGSKPEVFIPKDILSLMVCRVEYEEITKGLRVLNDTILNELLIEDDGQIVGKFDPISKSWIKVIPYSIKYSDSICETTFEYVASKTSGILPTGFSSHLSRN